MKDPTDSNATGKDVEDKDKGSAPEEMSLADLLGGPASEEGSGPKRVDHRADEPGSGMVKLAAMVASSTPEQARTPSIAPPPPAQPTAAAALPPDATPTGGIPVGQPVVVQQVHTRSAGPIYALIAVVVIAAAGVIYFVAQKPAAQTEDPNIAALVAKINEMEKEKAGQSAADAAEMEKKLASLQADLASARQQAAVKSAAPEVAKPEPAEPAAEAQKSASREDKPRSHGGSSRSDSRPKEDEQPSPAPAAKVKTGGDDDPYAGGGKAEPAAAPGAKSNDLDALLGTKKEEKEEPAAKKEAAASGLPSQPSKDDVKNAMTGVAARSAACSKYSTGTVQLKIVVGSNGKVKSSSAMGSFANTTAGKCVEMLARTAKFPKFSDPTFTFMYPITLR